MIIQMFFWGCVMPSNEDQISHKELKPQTLSSEDHAPQSSQELFAQLPESERAEMLKTLSR